jgi:hypothetical protein
VRFLINTLKIHSADEVFNVVEKYYPPQQIRPATKFFIEEMVQQ